MRLIILGTASSQGIPQPLCHCYLCQNAKGKDKRLRSSYLIELDSGENILLDASPDWREQQINYRFDFDYLFLSHRHRDHTQGLEEMRVSLGAHCSRRRPFQKKRVILLGKTLNRWLSNGYNDSRWQESVQQAYQQLLSRSFFKKLILIPRKPLPISPNVRLTYIKGKHGQHYCGGLVIEESSKSIVYLADIASLENKTFSFLKKLKPDLLIAHTPFFYQPLERKEQEKHPGIRQVSRFPGKTILLSHFSHNVKLGHCELIKRARKISGRISIAYDGQTITL
jgi:phosphoribosyl 1,2-cyclic phosphate phosphodiesterase